MDKTSRSSVSFLRRLAAGVALIALAASAELAAFGVAAADNPQLLRVATQGNNDLAYAAAVDKGGNFILAGLLDDSSAPSTYGVAKFSPEGRLLWRAHYVGSETDGAVHHVAVDSAGNVIATGTIVSAETASVLTVKFTPDGTQMWARRAAAGAGTRVAVDDAGNIYVGGAAQSNGAGNADWLLLKYDTRGTLLWQQTSDGPAHGDDRIVDMQLGADNQLAVTGYREYLTPGFGSQTAIAKFDADGKRRWLRTYLATGQRDSLPMDLTLDARGDVYVTGLTSADMRNTGFATVPFSLKFGPSGVPQLELNGAGAGGASVDSDSQGNLIVAGAISQDLRDPALAGALQSSVSKYDGYGTRLWNVKLGARGGVDVVRARVVGGNIYVAGSFLTSQGVGYLTRKLTPEGNTLWEHRRRPGGRDVASDLVVDAGRALVVGQSSDNLQTDVVALLFSELAPDVAAGGTMISTSQ